MNEIKRCPGCGVELNFSYNHEENCFYKDGVYPVQYICEKSLGADSINNFLREEEHGRE